MKIKFKTSAYQSAENYLKKDERATVILAQPQIIRQWDDNEKKYTDSVIAYKYSFTYDGAEDVLVVKFDKEQNLKQWDQVTFDNLEVFENVRENKAFFRAGGVKHVG